MALSGEIKMQDVYMPIGGLRSHADGINARWIWMKENWETVGQGSSTYYDHAQF